MEERDDYDPASCHGVSFCLRTSAFGRLEKCVALLLQYTTDQCATPGWAAAHHLFRQYVDLPPPQALREADRRAVYHVADTTPQNGPLAHRTWLGSGVKNELAGIELDWRLGQPIDGVDLAVPSRVERRFVPALGHDLTAVAIHDHGSERSVGHIRRQLDGPPHGVLLIEVAHHRPQFIHVIDNCKTVAIEPQTKYDTWATAIQWRGLARCCIPPTAQA